MKIKSLLILCFCTLLMASCTSYKSVPYLQNPEAVNNYQETLPMYDAKIMPKDLLTITVNTSDPEASAPYNLAVQTSMNVASNRNLTTQPVLQQINIGLLYAGQRTHRFFHVHLARGTTHSSYTEGLLHI